MDLLENGLIWARDTLLEHASKQVTYRRGADSLAVRAVIGRTLLKLDDGLGGARMEWTDRDFLVATEDLVLDGEQIYPQRGDKIIEADGDKTYIYEVLSPGDEPEWRWSDPYHKMMRIHTKLMEEV